MLHNLPTVVEPAVWTVETPGEEQPVVTNAGGEEQVPDQWQEQVQVH